MDGFPVCLFVGSNVDYVHGELRRPRARFTNRKWLIRKKQKEKPKTKLQILQLVLIVQIHLKKKSTAITAGKN